MQIEKIYFGFLLATTCVWVWMVCSLHSVTTGSRDRANVSLIIAVQTDKYIQLRTRTNRSYWYCNDRAFLKPTGQILKDRGHIRFSACPLHAKFCAVQSEANRLDFEGRGSYYCKTFNTSTSCQSWVWEKEAHVNWSMVTCQGSTRSALP